MRQVLMLCFWVLVLVACRGRDTNEQTFATLSEASAKGALGEGAWLPKFLPPSSSDITVRFNIDTNEVWVAFSWDGVNRGELAKQCHNAVASDILLPERSPSWWPVELTQTAPRSAASMGTELHTCSDGGFAALQPAAKRAYYWHRG
jgi:hypothetical protein